MKTKEIAKNFAIDQNAFDQWLKASSHQTKSSAFGGLEVADGQDVELIVNEFKVYQAELSKAREEKAAQDLAERQRKKEALANMLITSGFSFDGYTITRYSGYVSGDDAVQVPRSQGSWWSGTTTTDVGKSLMESLVKIRRQALTELKEAAYALGCNAVIGVDFDYITLDPETAGNNGGTLYLPYVFGVTANGNAVFIEKNR